MVKRESFSVGLVGAGNMGSAMLAGWLPDALDPAMLTVIDPAPPEASRKLIERHGIRHCGEPPEGPAPDILLLAVKPQIMEKVIAGVRHLAGPETVVVSVAAGVTTEQLRLGFGGHDAVVRAMPNTPALIGRGITVGYASAQVSNRQRARVNHLLSAVGSFEWVADETLIDAVTAVSGSGPAYVFHLAECMARAGTRAGLPEMLALQLACETVAGAGELMRRSDDGPARLREKVTSPNGTTAAALDVLMGDDAMAGLIDRAIDAARQRSKELSEKRE